MSKKRPKHKKKKYKIKEIGDQTHNKDYRKHYRPRRYISATYKKRTNIVNGMNHTILEESDTEPVAFYARVIDYFSDKASTYDLVDNQYYWKLSDELLWYLLRRKVLFRLRKKHFYFLDAGGGTGRWSERILRNYKLSSGVIYDISEDMLRIADLKRKNDLEDRLELYRGNIENIYHFKDETFDFTINFHNVLGFVNSPFKALSELARITKRKGFVVSVVPNKYHCIYFNLKNGEVDEALRAYKTNMGRFTKDMPYIHLFTPESIRKLYSSVGLDLIRVYGFPVTIYPGKAETTVAQNSKDLEELLSDKDNFNRIFEMEKNLILNPEISARGNNLFVVGVKTLRTKYIQVGLKARNIAYNNNFGYVGFKEY